MHDIRFIRDNPEAFDARAQRGAGWRRDAHAADRARREAPRRDSAAETAQARRNAASKEIGEAKKNKDEEKAKALLAEVAALKESIPAMEADEKKASKDLNDALAEIPNLPLDDVPDGKDENDNVEHHHFGAKRDYAFKPKQHFELGEALGQMDFEAAAKLSGARFVVLKKALRGSNARSASSCSMCIPASHTTIPKSRRRFLVRDEVMFGTAQLPKFEEDQFYCNRHDRISSEARALNRGGLSMKQLSAWR